MILNIETMIPNMNILFSSRALSKENTAEKNINHSGCRRDIVLLWPTRVILFSYSYITKSCPLGATGCSFI